MMGNQQTTTRLSVNGEESDVVVSPSATLLEVLREDLGLTGTNHGCETGECGACTVLVDGDPVLSCLTLAVEAAGREITTVEGLRGESAHPLQESFVENGAAQCGYCTPGMLMTAKHLLDTTDDPSRDEIEMALEGNICRCTGYQKILDAVEAAATSSD